MGDYSLEIKQQGHEAQHLPLSSVGVKKDGAVYLPPYIPSWHAWGPLYFRIFYLRNEYDKIWPLLLESLL